MSKMFYIAMLLLLASPFTNKAISGNTIATTALVAATALNTYADFKILQASGKGALKGLKYGRYPYEEANAEWIQGLLLSWFKSIPIWIAAGYIGDTKYTNGAVLTTIATPVVAQLYWKNRIVKEYDLWRSQRRHQEN